MIQRLVHNWKMRRRANGKGIEAKDGEFYPPISSITFDAFINKTCQRCKNPIPESTLFGNAWVVSAIGDSDTEILILCSKCRTGRKCQFHPNHPFVVAHPNDESNNSTIDRRVIVGEILTLTNYKEWSFSYHDILLCLRNVGGFQSPRFNNPFDGFSAAKIENGRKRFGNPIPGSCDECGALWINEYEYNIQDRKKILRERDYSDTECWSCHFQHSDQWFMRTSYEEEHRLILRLPFRYQH